MSQRVVVVWDDALTSYDFGEGHPLRPLRLELTMALARDLGVLDRPGVQVHRPAPAADALLQLVHDPRYLAAVRAASADPTGQFASFGLGSADNPVFAGMHEASALTTGASVAAAQAVWSGRAQHAVNLAGGLHHAMPDHASGFCVYNDPAVAIAWLLQQGARRIAYVDVDVHHGDGVQAVFYADPRVLTVSLHESGRYLFPGTGFADERGTGEGLGTAVNVALPPGVGDRGWWQAFEAIVPPVVRRFGPEVLVTQLGCDSHAEDPLAHLQLSVDGQRRAYRALHELAHEVCAGRWIATGGGGYGLVAVVPRAWTHALAEITGAPLPVGTPTPAGWRRFAAERSGIRPPDRMGDPPYPETEHGLAAAIAETRAAVLD